MDPELDAAILDLKRVRGVLRAATIRFDAAQTELALAKRAVEEADVAVRNARRALVSLVER